MCGTWVADGANRSPRNHHWHVSIWPTRACIPASKKSVSSVYRGGDSVLHAGVCTTIRYAYMSYDGCSYDRDDRHVSCTWCDDAVLRETCYNFIFLTLLYLVIHTTCYISRRTVLNNGNYRQMERVYASTGWWQPLIISLAVVNKLPEYRASIRPILWQCVLWLAVWHFPRYVFCIGELVWRTHRQGRSTLTFGKEEVSETLDFSPSSLHSVFSSKSIILYIR